MPLVTKRRSELARKVTDVCIDHCQLFSCKLFSYSNEVKRDSESVFISESVSEALGFLDLRGQEENQSLYVDTYNNLLQLCTKSKSLAHGRRVHAHMVENRFQSNLFLQNILLNMYAKCRYVVDACQIFSTMPEQDVFTWTMMITCYSEYGYPNEALKLFIEIQDQGLEPNNVTYVSTLRGCSNMGALGWGKHIHSQLMKGRLKENVFLANALLAFYDVCGSVEDAGKVFDRMHVRDMISWNTLISAYTQKDGSKSLILFEEMQSCGFRPNHITYATVLTACASIEALEWGKSIHAHLVKARLKWDIFIGNSLIDMYAKCGRMIEARRVFNEMPMHDLVSWTALITGYAEQGNGRESIRLFDMMQKQGLKPDGVAYVSILNACSHAGLLNEGSEYFISMRRIHGIHPTAEHYACMVDLFGRLGWLDEAKKIIERMPFPPDAVIWTALLSASRLHGNAGLAQYAARELLKLEPSNSAALVSLSNSYAAEAGEAEIYVNGGY